MSITPSFTGLVFVIVCQFTLVSQGMCQGVELTPDSVYENIEGPPIDAGSSVDTKEKVNGYIIPHNYFPLPGSQGNTETCVGWAIGYAMLGYNTIPKGSLPSKPFAGIAFSPWYLYMAIDQQSDLRSKQCPKTCSCGIRADLALKFLNQTGNVPMGLYPACPSDCVFPPLNDSFLKSEAAKYKIPAAYKVYRINSQREIRSYIENDIPVIVILEIDKAFQDFKDHSGNKSYKWEGPEIGMHAVVVVGYSEKLKAFQIINSHGTKWGNGGYGWIDYTSYNSMARQGFTMQKLGNEQALVAPANTISPLAGASAQSAPISVAAKDFTVHGTSENIRPQRYHYTFSIHGKTEALAQVKKVVYSYDHPTFLRKESTSEESPNFSNSYDGWGCLDKMKARIYLWNDSIINLSFNGCGVIRVQSDGIVEDPSQVAITPYVTATHVSFLGMRPKKNIFLKSAKSDLYKFKIQLRGITPIKARIDSVTYFWHDPSMSRYNGVLTLKPEYAFETDFEGSYSGWGCLSNVEIILYFDNKKNKTIKLDMCDNLGWMNVAEGVLDKHSPGKL